MAKKIFGKFPEPMFLIFPRFFRSDLNFSLIKDFLMKRKNNVYMKIFLHQMQFLLI